VSDDRRRFSAWREGRAADVTRAVSRALRGVGWVGLAIDDMIRDARACRSLLWEWEAIAALGELRGLGLVDRSRSDRKRGEATARWYWRVDVPTPGSWRTSIEDLCREVDRVLDEIRRWEGERWVRIEEVCRVVAGPRSASDGARAGAGADADDAKRIEHGLERLYDAGLVEAYEHARESGPGEVDVIFRHTR
jgi:hypothetical protein